LNSQRDLNFRFQKELALLNAALSDIACALRCDLVGSVRRRVFVEGGPAAFYNRTTVLRRPGQNRQPATGGGSCPARSCLAPPHAAAQRSSRACAKSLSRHILFRLEHRRSSSVIAHDSRSNRKGTKVRGRLCHGNERRLGKGQGPVRAHAAAANPILSLAAAISMPVIQPPAPCSDLP
jgi:hypothetical protein